ncbi:MAG: DUF2147 domain-containing protein [Bacteroidales bacterium]|nr:DUF2147 domain-containing protein [Bacteroidales bacterium]MCF8337311.1 DUF2147 domain-containing protein [Bacteroidales bacterium]
MKKTIFLLFTIIAPILLAAQTDADAVTGLWYNEEKDARFRIYEEDGKYFAKIVWLEEPIDPETDEPKLDDENPDEDLQDRPIKGLVFMKDFVYDGDGEWEDGEIYDPKSGKTYDCYIEMKSPDKLKVRGYIGISLLGRTQYWTRAEE